MELVDRSAKESAFAANLARSFADYRHTLEPYLSRGEPIPENVWSEIEKDMQTKLAAILLILFADSAVLHGLESSLAQQSGVAFAQQQAAELAGQFIANSRSQLAGALGSETPVPSDSRTVVLTRTFSPARAATMATTETTTATSAGGEEAVRITVGVSEFDLWFTENDGRVCPRCGPLHGKKRSEWQSEFPLGPPAHPNCRCRIEYEFERN